MSIATQPSEKRVLLSNVSWSTFMDLVRLDCPGAVRLRSRRSRNHDCLPGARTNQEANGDDDRGGGAEDGSFAYWHWNDDAENRNEEARPGAGRKSLYRPCRRAKDADELDLSVNPPPDLAIEIDITSSSLDQLAIYADMGVPEAWIYNDEAIHVRILQADGRYREQCKAFPFLFFRWTSSLYSSVSSPASRSRKVGDPTRIGCGG